MQVVTLLARHGTHRYSDAVESIGVLLAKQLPTAEPDVVVIDTSLAEDYEQRLDHRCVLIGSSNADWEFSAWDRALQYLGQRVDNYDLVHLATSAFRALPAPYLDCIDSSMLARVRDRAAVLGHIDYYDEPVIVHGRSTQAWLRSSWLFLPPHELRLLGSVVSVDDPTPYFSGNPQAPFRLDAPLSVNYQAYILGWLTGEGTGQGVSWHSRFALTRETLAYFEAKAKAILNEQLLSVRLRAQGCVMVDVTWLAARQAQLAAGQPLGVIPSWRWQIAAREAVLADRQ
jgi:hypothetical protein